nr:PREDICTED: lamina-associated polypeptide 2, isoforms beta/gamma-like isoform X2 [Paralichthys olivaceus]
MTPRRRHNSNSDRSLRQTRRSKEKEENPEEAEIPDLSGLTDDDLKAALLRHGFKPGPIVASTRALYEKKLSKLLQSDGHNQPNGAEKATLYSASEEEEEENGEDDEAESGAEEEKQKAAVQSDEAQPGSSQVQAGSQTVAADASSLSSQVFSITEMVEEMESRGPLSTSTNTVREFNGSNVQEHWSRSSRLDMPVVDNSTMKNNSLYYTPRTSPHKREMKKPPREPVNDTFKDLLPAETTPMGIYATRRRPIKGAAGRPVQYAYPDTPVSPTTLERREVERRLVPVHIRFLFFLIMVCILYLVYALV